MEAQGQAKDAAQAAGNHVTLDTLEGALAQFDERKDGAGELHLFVQHPGADEAAVAWKPDDDKAKTPGEHVLHSRISRACSKARVSAKVMAITQEGAQLCFSRAK